MIYNAIGLQTNCRDSMSDIGQEPNFSRNLKHIKDRLRIAILQSLEYEPKLVALCEGAIQGFPDEVRNFDHVAFAHKGAIRIPGPVTDELSELAQKYKIYLIAQSKEILDEFPDRYFNCAFVINPEGKIILKHYKNVVFTPEGSCTPHDVFDRWVEMFGSGLDAFFPVARTEIGNIGCCVCMEGNFPETARGAAMNGAEIIYRPSSVEHKVSIGVWEVQNRARAVDNQCYVIAPQTGNHTVDDEGSQGYYFGGQSMIVDYRGQILHKNSAETGDAFVAAPINIEALRYHRTKSKHINWMPFLKNEVYRLIYDKVIMPKNLAMDVSKMPRVMEQRNQIIDDTVAALKNQGVFER